MTSELADCPTCGAEVEQLDHVDADHWTLQPCGHDAAVTLHPAD